ncbi:lipocalin family protein [Maribacter sp. CXY002]|uniref:lipocalin family protein n=1 Tax=Maribacter luteocoastalis TaxID=3407671 RepID=UPI003B6746B3
MALIGSISCSNEHVDIQDQDLIIGTWKPIKEVGFANDGTPETFENTPCEQTSRYILTSNGNFTYSEFHDETGGGCVPDESYIITGTWTRIATGQYRFDFEYFNSETQQTESDSQIPDKVTFSNANNLMRIIEQVDVGEEYIEFERIN